MSPQEALRKGRSVTRDPGDLFAWPIVTREDEEAVLDVLRRGAMSGTDVTKAFEQEIASWMGMTHALGYCNGTESLRAAMWACGVGAGDEVIAPSLTYWASCASALSLGAAVHFADCLPDTLTIDPEDVARKVGPRTKAIVVVHYAGRPCQMDPILAVARKRGVKVIEDVSHAHGAVYKKRLCGTMGDVGAMSMMTGKGFPVGEGGMLVTNDRLIYERAVSYGHYERTGVASRFNEADAQVAEPELARFAGVPIGGFKHRMNQMSSAMGRVQLKAFPARIAEIQKAMNRFWDLLEGVPGIRAHRPPKDSGVTMGCWYFPLGLYRQKELGGLKVDVFCERVRAEGVEACRPGANAPLHLHPVFHEADLFRQGKPTMIAFGQRDVRLGPGSLPVTEAVPSSVFQVPWFKHDRPAEIAEYAAAFRKVAEEAAAK